MVGRILAVLLCLCICSNVFGGETKLLSWWKFDEGRGRKVLDTVSGKEDDLEGIYTFADGVSGKCLKLDGYTGRVVRKGESAPEFGDSFTIEAWIAAQTYPWNWTGIVEQGCKKPEDDKQNQGSRIVPRVSLAIDAEGHVIFGGLIGGKWQQCRSENRIELLKWNHIAGSYDKDNGLAVYINGGKAGSVDAKGRLYGDSSGMLYIGRGVRDMSPVGTERDASRKTLSMMVFDGFIDEVKIYDRALNKSEVLKAYDKSKPAEFKVLKYRRMPKGPEGQAENFGAVYCRLRYDDLWERPWRVGEHSDILVRFDESPVRVAFWRGTNFGASWITENDIWMGDQSLEDSGTGWGLSEHMADKQCRYSHVRLVENNDARVVVHWRYAVADIRYTINHADEITGWGDWTDEYHYIYPDAVGTRKQILWSGAHGGFQWQETIVFNQPGTRPEDNIELDAMTIANIEGQSKTYSWAGGSPDEFDGPENADIQLTNLKSRYKPFIVFDNDGGEIKAFGDGHELSVFPWWNHWPAGMIPSDGREVTGFDRPSHSSLSYRKPRAVRGKGDSAVAFRLCGMTDKGIEYAVRLARSWQRAPELRISSGGFEGKGYDKYQRAYVIDRIASKPGEVSSDPYGVKFSISASEQRPIINPAFVIKNWGSEKPVLKVDGRRIKDPKVFRFGYNMTVDGNDLVVWVKMESEKTVEFAVLSD